jgi:hypothetical protein
MAAAASILRVGDVANRRRQPEYDVEASDGAQFSLPFRRIQVAVGSF